MKKQVFYWESWATAAKESPWAQFGDAIRSGRANTVRTLIEQYGLSTIADGGYSLLFIATSTKRPAIVKTLLNNGAPVNLKSFFKFNPLCLAIQKGYTDIAELLLKKGSDVYCVGATSVSDIPIMCAMQGDDSTMVKLLFKYGFDLNASIEQVDAFPVHIAAENKREKVLKFLLRVGADVDASKGDHNTPLYIAALRGHLTVVKQLLRYRPNVDNEWNQRTLSRVIREKPKFCKEIGAALRQYGFKIDPALGTTPSFFHDAVAVGCWGIVRDLVNDGADVNSTYGVCGDTPLHVAAEYGNANILKLLNNLGARFKTNHCNRTPMHRAASAVIVETLLEFGAEVNSKDDKGLTPLHVAALWGKGDVVESLINFGANVDEPDNDGATPLHWAAKMENKCVVELLLEHCADVNITNAFNMTALATCLHFYSPRPEANSTDDAYQVIQCLVFHIDKMVKIDLEICEQNQLAVAEARSKYPHLENLLTEHGLLCRKEAEKMKYQSMNGCGISFYDFLVEQSNSREIKLAKNNIIRFLKNKIFTPNFKKLFPVYNTLFKSQFRLMAQRKLLMDQTCEIFDCLPNRVKLPTDCVEEIMEFLSDDELRVFVWAMKTPSFS